MSSSSWTVSSGELAEVVVVVVVVVEKSLSRSITITFIIYKDYTWKHLEASKMAREIGFLTLKKKDRWYPPLLKDKRRDVICKPTLK